VSTGQTVLLGAIAGATIFLGLPLGRLKAPRLVMKALLHGASAGILLFLLLEIFEGAFDPLEHAVEKLHRGEGGIGPVFGFGAVFVVGIGLGLLSLLYVTKYQRSRRPSPTIGPGAMSLAEAPQLDGRRAA